MRCLVADSLRKEDHIAGFCRGNDRRLLAGFCRQLPAPSLSPLRYGCLRKADLRAAVGIALGANGTAPRELSQRMRSPEDIPSRTQLRLASLARLFEPSRGVSRGRNTTRTHQLDVLAPTLRAPTHNGRLEQVNRKPSRRLLLLQTERWHQLARERTDLFAKPLSIPVPF